ncbi:hypothetical protein SNE40_011897 [Patella caerulea]|uniref:EGF-like domain-containing protein n=1 Tax=Patella caerulea TaxID=87958 RepID=A0AAN8JQC0_PATCE
MSRIGTGCLSGIYLLFYLYYMTDRYGGYGQELCSTGCQNTACNNSTGICTGGCRSFFTGRKCETCVQGRYGSSCQLSCNSGCIDNYCNKDNGYCTRGCIDSRYGSTCASSCTITNCIDNCDQDSGQCSACKQGFFGLNCQYPCSDDCIGGCDKITGTCTECKPDIVGPYCNMSCGSGCVQVEAKFIETCYRNGTCNTCIGGRHGDKCDLKCSTGCVAGCRRIDGRCSICIKGKSGPTCTTNCGTYCTACQQDDPNDCSECVPGKTRNNCAEDCPAGLYGMECKNKCGNCANNTPCDVVTGDCGTVGCLPDFTGTSCQQLEIKDEEVSPAVGGVIGALFGIAVTSAVCIVGFNFYIKRKYPAAQSLTEASSYEFNSRSAQMRTKSNQHHSYESAKHGLHKDDQSYTNLNIASTSNQPRNETYVNLESAQKQEANPYVNLGKA